MLKPKGLEPGYLMSQLDCAKALGLGQQTVSKAEASMLRKIRVGLLKHNVTEAEFLYYLKMEAM